MKSKTDSLDKVISEFSEIPKLTKVGSDKYNVENKVLFDTEVFNNVNDLKKEKQYIVSYEWRVEF